MKPMLAKKFADQGHKLTSPFFVQPKLNGVRGLYCAGQFQSRDEKLWAPEIVEHVTDALANVPPWVVLDGEFYVHGWPLQKINGSISVNRIVPSTLTPCVEYHVFDCLNGDDLDMVFSDRIELLYSSLETGGPVYIVDTHEVYSHAEADHYYEQYKSLNYEGMMYRENVPYGLVSHCGNKENRWPTLLKRKDWLDEDCEIIEANLGTGKYADAVGSLVLRFPNGRTFSAGSGLSDMQRQRFLDSPPIGKYAKIKYEMLSVDGVPLKPVIEAVLD